MRQLPVRRTILILSLLVAAAACSPSSPAAPSTTVTSTSGDAPTPSSAPPGPTTTAPTPLDERPEIYDTWTLVLASLPAGDFTIDDAQEVASSLGIDDEVISSGTYPSLNAGFWVVRQGEYDSRFQASLFCSDYADAPDCYPRYLGDDPTIAIGPETDSVLADVDGRLVVLSTETGELTRTVASAWGEGEFPSVPDHAPGALVGYSGVAFEDYWFSCEASAGELWSVDLTTGDTVTIGQGFGPRVSPDGTMLAYLATSTCIPDPEVEGWWQVFVDTIVVRDLATGDEQRFTVDEPAQGSPESDLRSLAWGRGGIGLYVHDGGQVIRLFNPDAGGSPLAAPIIASGFGVEWTVLGLDDQGSLLMSNFDPSTEATALSLLDPATQIVAPLDLAFPGLVSIAVDTSGAHIAIGKGSELVIGDTQLTVFGEISGLNW